jgi:hypothetical protein
MASKFTTEALLDPSSLSTMHDRSVRGLRIHVEGVDGDAATVLRGQQPRTKLRGRIGQSGRVTDVVGTFHAELFLISERFVRYLAEQRLTGWHAEPVEIALLDAPLSLLQVHGRCGPVITASAAQPLGGSAFGSYLDPGRWDQSDLMVPDNLSRILLTPRAATALLAAKLSNLSIEAAGLETIPTDHP